MASSTCSLACDTFHGTAIAEETESVVVDEVEARLVEDCSRMRLRNSEPHSVRETLTEWSCRDFDTISVM